MTTDWGRLRQVMYEPSAVWLSTDYGGDRWLTDQFVLYRVTGYDELSAYDFHVCLGYDPSLGYEPLEGECSCPDVIPDAPYQLTVSKGFKPRKSVPQPDIDGYFAKLEDKIWMPARPSEWSVAEHPGKAMLWTFGAGSVRPPCLIGESTWTALKRHHPDAVVEYTPEGNIFRLSEVRHIDLEGDCAASECACLSVPFAFVAGIQVPEGQEHVAGAIAAVSSGRGYYPMVNEADDEDSEEVEEAA